jgi:predicted NBD/HSP70 family sugar kinase
LVSYLGIDVGGTSIKYGVYNEYGEEIKNGKNKIRTPKYDMSKFLKSIKLIIDECGPVNGIGLSIPGCVNPNTGYIQDGGSIRVLDKVNIKYIIEKELGVKVEVENDANCALLAEKWIGNATECSNFVCITLGTGIGGALYINNGLVSGNNYFSGEFGYMILDNIHEKYKIKTLNKTSSTVSFVRGIANKKGLNPKSLDGLSVFDMIRNKDDEVIELYKAWIRRVAICIYNVGFIVDPEKIIIGGGISNQSIFIDDLKSEIKRLSIELLKETGKIENLYKKWNIGPCKFFNDSGKIGAVYNYKIRNRT